MTINTGNIYEFLASIQERPGMYVRDQNLHSVEILLLGYVACLDANGVEETYQDATFTPQLFGDWLLTEKGWSAARGFTHAILENAQGNRTAFEEFFVLVEEFRSHGQFDQSL